VTGGQLIRPSRAEIAHRRAARERALMHFGWPAIARKTVDLYDRLLGGS
jgi:glycosyltransferase involved in cell wall biosynthesis